MPTQTTSLNDLLSWVVTRWKPTVAQVKAWMNSFRHKDDPITIDDLEANLKTYIQGLGSGGSGGGGSVYPTGSQRFVVTASQQSQFIPAIDITSIPANKIIVTNGVRVDFNKDGNKIVLNTPAAKDEIVYIDVI